MEMNVELKDLTKENIKQFRRLNQVVLPVSYGDKFYKEAHLQKYAKVAYINNAMVGGISCRVVTHENQKRLYIMTLACLSPYRRMGIGKKLLGNILELCENGDIVGVSLHVQTDNDVALTFYQKFGFEIVKCVKNYYNRCDTSDAYLLEKKLT